MKQNILIAALLAGMLALAGCGGGSSSATGSGNTGNTGSTSGPVTLTETGLSYEKDGANEYRVLKDTPLPTPNGKITCPVDECIITVAAQGGTPVVTATGGATFEKTAPPPDPSGTAQPTDSTDPLSPDVLFKVLSGAETIWKAKTDSPVNLDGSKMDAVEGSKTTSAWLRSIGAGATLKKDGDYIYWGLWSDSTKESGSEKVTQGSYGAVMGGGNPYGKKPDSPMNKAGVAVTTATYSGSAVVHYRAKSTDKWTPVNGKTAMLKANFSTGMIGGNMATSGGDFGDSINIGDILFRDTSIGSDGQFSGNVENAMSTGETGSWNGQFFGDTTGFTTGTAQNPRKSISVAPSRAAATFSMSRPETKTGSTVTQSALHIRGAFGGPCNPACQ